LDYIDKFKLFFTTSYSTGAINPPETIKAEPGVVCTETFIVIGPFTTEKEMNNCWKYLQTDFLKVLLYFGKGTMHVTKDVFCYVPIQDFTENSDIDWSLSLEDISASLYDKYSFDKSERDLFTSLCNPKK
jgi:hypothetical protein